MAEVQKPFLIIAEDVVEAYIVRTLIDVGDNKVYVEAAGSYQRIPSTIRTYQINHPGEFNYIAIFNANRNDDFSREEKIAMVRNLCRAKKSIENIGIFCFRNNIETELNLPRLNTASGVIKALTKNIIKMKQSPTIIEIQKFIDTITNKH